MKRPFITQLLPNRLKQSLYYRHFHTRHAEWLDLFAAAPLSFSETLCMYDLVPGDVISGNIAFNGFYELDLTRHLFQRARGGGLLVDVGANMGYFSLLWTGSHPSSRAIAIEAAPRNVGLIDKNIGQNRLDNRVSLIPKAAGDRCGTISFDLGPIEQTGWGGISRETSHTTIDVPMIRLDEELSDATIDVLKIDVEGAESWVLYGCEKLLKEKRIKTIFFEQNDERMKILGITDDEARIFLRSLGYTCVPISKSGDDWMAFPARA